MSEETETYYDTVYFDIIRFLEEYEKLPCLWDKNHSGFKDKKERVIAEENLGEILGIEDLKTLRRKIRTVRGTYNAEIRKIKLSLDDNEIHIPRLSWFSIADHFLRVTTDLPVDIQVPPYKTGHAYTPKKKLSQKQPKKDGVRVLMVRAANKFSDKWENNEMNIISLDDDTFDEKELQNMESLEDDTFDDTELPKIGSLEEDTFDDTELPKIGSLEDDTFDDTELQKIGSLEDDTFDDTELQKIGSLEDDTFDDTELQKIGNLEDDTFDDTKLQKIENLEDDTFDDNELQKIDCLEDDTFDCNELQRMESLEEDIFDDKELEFIDEGNPRKHSCDSMSSSVKFDTYDEDTSDLLSRRPSNRSSSPDFQPSARKKPKSTSDAPEDTSLADVMKTLKEIQKTSENEFASFGRSVAVQLQSLPIEIATQLQTDIQAHITRMRLDYFRSKKLMNND